MSIYDDLDYIDGITIIDTSGIILFTVKFNPELNAGASETIVGKKLFDVFTNLNPANSTLLKCMEVEKPIFTKDQVIEKEHSKKYLVDSLTLPIKNNGRIVGAIDITKSINNEESELKALTETENDINKITKIKNIKFADKARFSLSDIVCANKEMKELIQYAYSISKSASPVFIYGDTGTGKELFAHGIHNASSRKDNPFIAQNCSAIPDTLLESILFGTSKGSFTGAVDKKGLFEIANGGTLFLDEIHAMPLHLQAKLLRVTQDGYIRRIGDEVERKVDVRLIVATNVDYSQILRGDIIREDLFYRLAVINIRIPPLKERREDIIPLVNHLIKRYDQIFDKKVLKISDEMLNFMLAYDWPGNVRELENVMEACFNVVPEEKDTLELDYLPIIYKNKFNVPKRKPLKKILETNELQLIKEALFYSKGNISNAAKLLELPRQTLQQKMIKYGISKRDIDM